MWFRYWAMAFEIYQSEFHICPPIRSLLMSLLDQLNCWANEIVGPIRSLDQWNRWTNKIVEPMTWRVDKAIKGPSNAWYTRIRCTWSFGIWTGWSRSWHVVNWGHHIYSSFWLFPISRFVIFFSLAIFNIKMSNLAHKAIYPETTNLILKESRRVTFGLVLTYLDEAQTSNGPCIPGHIWFWYFCPERPYKYFL